MRLNVHLELGDGAAVEQRDTWIETDDHLPFALQLGDLGARYSVIIIKQKEESSP